MRSEIKKLKEMSESTILSKPCRDAIKWALGEMGELEEKEQKKTSNEYPDEFEWLWSNYPERSGGKGSKRDGYQKCKALIKSGENWKSLARYMKAYEDHCKLDEKIGTSFVMMFTSFFSSGERYKDDYSIKKQEKASEKQSGFSAMVERANSGELYKPTQEYYLAANGKKYTCASDYFAGKDPIE